MVGEWVGEGVIHRVKRIKGNRDIGKILRFDNKRDSLDRI